MEKINFEERLKQYAGGFASVVPFERGDKLLKLDFTAQNTVLTDAILLDTAKFSEYINQKLTGYRYGIGGYDEHRTIYSRSAVFGPSGPPLTPPPGENSAQPTLSGDTNVDEPEFYWEADVTVYKELKTFMLENRKNPTKAEKVLWQKLRGNQLDGYSFRRQHIVGRFIADFVCLAKKLIIEIDGLQHGLPENRATDSNRTLWLQMKGYEVMRFTNDDVLLQTNVVLQRISQKLREMPFATKRQYKKKFGMPQSGVSAAGGLPPVGEGRDGGFKENNEEQLPAEPRRLHLGIDIWGPTETPVYAPLEGTVHSFAFNEAYGDYGATLILQHDINGFLFHTLYGHLSLASIQDKQEGQTIAKGEWIAAFGKPEENGQWPPHLHFQVIIDMQGAKGDYPGVCKYSEREEYLANCPDGDLILGMMQWAS
jgi:very-short-patch-repair endonuclease